MHGVWNRVALLGLCTVTGFMHLEASEMLAPLLAAVILTALGEYAQDTPWQGVPPGVFILVAAFYGPLFFFLPLAAYDVWDARPRGLALLLLLPLATQLGSPQPLAFLLIVGLTALAPMLRVQEGERRELKSHGIALRDAMAELSEGLARKNRDLILQQDEVLNVATLRERGRIARDMHDTVGHLLSSALLQTGALRATCRDQGQREGLDRLHETLSRGMDGARAAIYDLHDESLDLYTELRALAEGFEPCPVRLDYDFPENPPRAVKLAIVAIVKEALANVARHARATRVDILLREHPALYQLVVRDNGVGGQGGEEGGLGLQNIRHRAEALGGLLNIDDREGFELFVTLPRRNLQEVREEEG